MGDGAEYTMLNYMIVKLVTTDIRPEHKSMSSGIRGKILEAVEKQDRSMNENVFWDLYRKKKENGT